jgi:hypothetical protein
MRLFAVLPSLLGVVCLSCLTRPVQADAIAVPNFSFQANPVADGGGTFDTDGWTRNGFAGTFNPTGSQFTNGADNSATGGVPPGGDGNQFGYIETTSSIQSASALTTVQAGATYELTISIGDFLGVESGTARIGFLFDDAFVTTGAFSYADLNTAATYSPEGEFSNYTLIYQAKSTDVGKGLKIFVGQNTNGTFAFDNVRLNVVATPEPSTYAMMILGLGALSVVGYRRKRHDLS